MPIWAIDLDGLEEKVVIVAIIYKGDKSEVVTSTKTWKELYPKDEDGHGAMGTGTLLLGYDKDGNINHKSYTPSIMDDVRDFFDWGGMSTWGSSTKGDNNTQDKTKRNIFASINLSELTRIFEQLSIIPGKAVKGSEKPKEDVGGTKMQDAAERGTDAAKNIKEGESHDSTGVIFDPNSKNPGYQAYPSDEEQGNDNTTYFKSKKEFDELCERTKKICRMIAGLIHYLQTLDHSQKRTRKLTTNNQ
jgi:hypothetical protein